MKQSLVCSLAMLFLLTFWIGAASATYTMEVIGTAQFVGATDSGDPEYKLIWDPDNNGNSVVWLDYSNEALNWTPQKNWAAGLDLTYNWYSDYSVSWIDSLWRLPNTVDGQHEEGCDGTTTVGYNITTSEMGHLFYTELGNKGYCATDGTNPQTGWGLSNTGDFNNLITTPTTQVTANQYWSGTEFTDESFPYDAWLFSMLYGNQYARYESHIYYGLAIRSGTVSVVPEPAPMLLFGVGLLGIAGVSRRRIKSTPLDA